MQNISNKRPSHRQIHKILRILGGEWIHGVVRRRHRIHKCAQAAVFHVVEQSRNCDNERIEVGKMGIGD